ncbi:helix-turn-helix transcriptional regulator [Clostridium butyricum]|uniref:HTH cro/C1-type domain-containing protein n=1 Tax=Clostridium butyricum TaxID=1492 RepID=A0A2S7FFI5_CLOBU|nr:helix-turn-helix transcriptional regulator [Clostridium butyricum]PPV17733.1 hypothetical protein AWN73_06940 [Clostridium butyricum]
MLYDYISQVNNYCLLLILSSSLLFKTASFKQKCEISVINAEITELEENSKNKDVAYWLKYCRKSENISQQTLADRIGIPSGNYIKQIENSELHPNREVSEKLAKYFKLETKYFFDPYLEDTDDCPNKLYSYRKSNNLLIKEAAKIAGVSPGTWSNWEKGRYGVTRENYLKLKDLRIL